MTPATATADAGPPTLRLRPLADGDAALFVAVYTDDAPLLGPVDPARAKSRRARARSGHGGTFFVVVADGTDAGVAGVVPRAGGHVEAGVVLAAAWRGRGVGTRVFAGLIDAALADAACAACVIRHAPGHPAMAAIAARLSLRPVPDADGIAWTATR